MPGAGAGRLRAQRSVAVEGGGDAKTEGGIGRGTVLRHSDRMANVIPLDGVAPGGNRRPQTEQRHENAGQTRKMMVTLLSPQKFLGSGW